MLRMDREQCLVGQAHSLSHRLLGKQVSKWEGSLGNPKGLVLGQGM